MSESRVTPRPVAFSRPGPNGVSSGAHAITSSKVRKLLKLEARAARLVARYERTITLAAPLLQRAERLRQQVRARELALTGTELGKLRRARSASAR